MYLCVLILLVSERKKKQISKKKEEEEGKYVKGLTCYLIQYGESLYKVYTYHHHRVHFEYFSQFCQLNPTDTEKKTQKGIPVLLLYR